MIKCRQSYCKENRAQFFLAHSVYGYRLRICHSLSCMCKLPAAHSCATMQDMSLVISRQLVSATRRVGETRQLYEMGGWQQQQLRIVHHQMPMPLHIVGVPPYLWWQITLIGGLSE